MKMKMIPNNEENDIINKKCIIKFKVNNDIIGLLKFQQHYYSCHFSKSL